MLALHCIHHIILYYSYSQCHPILISLLIILPSSSLSSQHNIIILGNMQSNHPQSTSSPSKQIPGDCGPAHDGALVNHGPVIGSLVNYGPVNNGTLVNVCINRDAINSLRAICITSTIVLVLVNLRATKMTPPLTVTNCGKMHHSS